MSVISREAGWHKEEGRGGAIALGRESKTGRNKVREGCRRLHTGGGEFGQRSRSRRRVKKAEDGPVSTGRKSKKGKEERDVGETCRARPRQGAEGHRHARIVEDQGMAREEASEARGCRKIGFLLGLMIGRGGSLLGWRGIRVGEAGTPGPYTEGGASASGAGARGRTWVEIGHGRWENDGALGVVGDCDIDVAFPDLDAWLDDKEAEQSMQEVECGGWSCGVEEATSGL